MDFVNAKDLEQCGELNKECTVLVLHEGAFHRMKMQDVLDYLAGANVTTDTTLLLKDIPAEAKATGEAIRKAAPRNLLDNSDFRNPVNQRGASSYTTPTFYTIDRWTIYASEGKVTLTVGSGSIKIANTGNGSLSQRLPKGLLDKTKTYTFAYKTINGNVIITNDVSFGDSFDEVHINLTEGQTIELVWAALYEGAYTAETVPEYQPKGYGAELVECMRYYVNSFHGNRSVDGCLMRIALTQSSIQSVIFPIPMRSVPSITLYNATTMQSGGVGLWKDDSFLACGTKNESNTAFILAPTNNDAIAGQAYQVHYEADANL